MNVVDRRPHRTRQIQPWHELFLIPLFALARPSSFSMGFWGLLLFYEVEAVAIFPRPPGPGRPTTHPALRRASRPSGL